MHRLKQQQCKNQNNLFRISLDTLQTITLYMYKHICNIEAYNSYDTIQFVFLRYECHRFFSLFARSGIVSDGTRPLLILLQKYQVVCCQ